MKTSLTSFGFCAENEMLNTSLNVREPSETLSAGCRNLDGGKGWDSNPASPRNFHQRWENLNSIRSTGGNYQKLQNLVFPSTMGNLLLGIWRDVLGSLRMVHVYPHPTLCEFARSKHSSCAEPGAGGRPSMPRAW